MICVKNKKPKVRRRISHTGDAEVFSVRMWPLYAWDDSISSGHVPAAVFIHKYYTCSIYIYIHYDNSAYLYATAIYYNHKYTSIYYNNIYLYIIYYYYYCTAMNAREEYVARHLTPHNVYRYR